MIFGKRKTGKPYPKVPKKPVTGLDDSTKKIIELGNTSFERMMREKELETNRFLIQNSAMNPRINPTEILPEIKKQSEDIIQLRLKEQNLLKKIQEDSSLP